MIPWQPSLIESMLASTAGFQPRFADDDEQSSYDLSLPPMRLLDFLDKPDLLALRATSRTVKTWVEADPLRYHTRVFKNLNYHGRVDSMDYNRRALEALARVAPYCHQLKISLYYEALAFNPPYLSLDGKENSFWIQAFGMISTTIHTVVISAPGINAWEYLAFDSFEKQVKSIRFAMEKKFTRGLHALHLDPVNAGALLNLRWRGATIGSASSDAEPFWSNLMWLKIKLFNPLPHLRHTNRVDFLKLLHDFLGSFRRSLRGLDFEWLGPEGPSPLMLDLVTDPEGLYRAEPFQWNGLMYARLTNTDAVEVTELEVVQETRARHLRKLIINDYTPRPLSPSSQSSSVASLSPQSSEEDLTGGPAGFDKIDALMFNMEL
ncbi:hypothetical protein IWZ00DRAFT_547162 [Phyllosticta capitalensis]